MKKNAISTPKIQLKAYSRREVAGFYEVSSKTLKKWLNPFEKEIGQRIGHYYSPKQVKIIFEKLGIPERIHLN